MSTIIRGFLALVLGTGTLFLLSACRSPRAADSGPQSADSSQDSVTLLEQKQLEVIEQEERLEAAAAVPDADEREIQRLFHAVAREYEGIIARNPRNLESRLLYGKLLSRYGDREGARVQFLSAAQLDPDVAVIHQQLSKYYAEEEDHTRALAYALNAVRIEPDVAAYHFGLGQLLIAYRDDFLEEEVFTREQLDNEMLRSFSKARSLQPDSLPLQFRYCEAYYDLEHPDWDIALGHWQDLASRQDLSPLQQDAVRVHQARCLSELGRYPEAETFLSQVQSPDIYSPPSDSLPVPDSPN